MEDKMKAKFLVGVTALALAAWGVLWTAGQASAHRWHHRVWAPYYGYSHSYYPTYAYGPGFVYTPDYPALLASLAYSASYGIRSDGMCAAVPWWPILFAAARENDDNFRDELVLVVAAHANYTRFS
jgi:hypothetical protein